MYFRAGSVRPHRSHPIKAITAPSLRRLCSSQFQAHWPANPRFYIGLVECIDEETGNCEVNFLKKCKVNHITGQTMFIFKEDFPEALMFPSRK